jgi:hypothetical protein
MAMLDKEVAEEKAEIAQTELDEVTEKLAIVEVELEIFKEGGVLILNFALNRCNNRWVSFRARRWRGRR